MKRFFLFVMVLSLGSWSMDVVLAQSEYAPGVEMKKVGQSTMNFLQVSVIPGASAMGEAYTAIGTGCESIFFNIEGDLSCAG